MAKYFNRSIIFRPNYLKLKPSMTLLHKQLHRQIPVKEIQIPVSYGNLSAKLWGSSEKRPILALHGWQDNAGTWDPLIPQIIKDRSILAIDLPGHGLSSWFPPDMMYHQWEIPRFILFLKEYFKWNKISILSHSMGAEAAMRYACLFPEDIDVFIALDNIIHDDFDINLLINQYPKLTLKNLPRKVCFDNEPFAHTMEEIKQIWHTGTNKSVALDKAHFLMERGVKQSKRDPNKYYFSRDPRLKNVLISPESEIFVEGLVKRLTCPMLYIKALDSPFGTAQFIVEMRNIIKRNNPHFDLQFVPGTHHVHLNNPEVVAPLILKFLDKYNSAV